MKHTVFLKFMAKLNPSDLYQFMVRISNYRYLIIASGGQKKIVYVSLSLDCNFKFRDTI